MSESGSEDSNGIDAPFKVKKSKRHKTSNKKIKVTETVTAPIPTSNRFDLLSQAFEQATQESMDTAVITPECQAPPATQEPVRSRRPPPITIHERAQSYAHLIRFIKETCGEQFKCRYSANTFTVFTEDMKNYEKVLNDLKKANIKFHTYQHVTTYNLVLKGLPVIDPDEIKNDLARAGFTPVGVHCMKQNENQPQYYLPTIHGEVQQ